MNPNFATPARLIGVHEPNESAVVGIAVAPAVADDARVNDVVGNEFPGTGVLRANHRGTD
jgi:hypothetical protein